MNNDIAVQGAVLESYFDDIAKSTLNTGIDLVDFDLGNVNSALAGYKLVAPVKTITNSGGEDNAKCIAVQDPNGNITVHFRGTGDGFWSANSAAYGEDSKVQKESTAFLESVIKDQKPAKVYVTGHSQGGKSSLNLLWFKKVIRRFT